MTAELTCPHLGQVTSETAVYGFADIAYSRRHLTADSTDKAEYLGHALNIQTALPERLIRAICRPMHCSIRTFQNHGFLVSY